MVTATKKKLPLGKVLVGMKLASVEQVKAGLKLGKENMIMLGEAMIELGSIDDEKVARALAKAAGRQVRQSS